MPNRSCFCPLFGFLCVDELKLSHEQAGGHSFFLMSFERTFFNTLNILEILA
jgi:hypothetical protein